MRARGTVLKRRGSTLGASEEEPKPTRGVRALREKCSGGRDAKTLEPISTGDKGKKVAPKPYGR
jgi:hypothetical protein